VLKKRENIIEKIEILLIILTIHNTIHTTNSILNTPIMPVVAQLRETVKNSNQENKRKLRDELYIKYFKE